MSRFAASIKRKPSEVPSDAYNGICSRLEDTGGVGIEGMEFLESPVSRARLQPTPPKYQERNSVVNRRCYGFAAGLWRSRPFKPSSDASRSEEHTSELQSPC